MSEVLKARAVVATKSRKAINASPEELAEAKAALVTAKLDAEIKRIVDLAPKLSPAQRDIIAAVFSGGGDLDVPA